jgi:hypothetical protein
MSLMTGNGHSLVLLPLRRKYRCFLLKEGIVSHDEVSLLRKCKIGKNTGLNNLHKKRVYRRLLLPLARWIFFVSTSKGSTGGPMSAFVDLATGSSAALYEEIATDSGSGS